MKLERLSGRKRNDYVLKKGKEWRGKHVRISYLMGAPRHPDIDPTVRAVYAGVTASAKLDKSAVKRNRMRRRIREAMRLYLKKHDVPTVQLIARPRSSSLSCAFGEIAFDVSSFFSSL